jgi:cell wall-associated NlpC family hydrolase
VTTTKKQAERSKNYNRVYKKPVMSSPESSIDEGIEMTVLEPGALMENAVAAALKYEGTTYKYGGNDRRGMDCSGLICTSFREAGKKVPRTSSSLKAVTTTIDVDDLVKGDLLFFATGRNKNRLNHVGMVVNITPAEVQFIHSSTSRGVIISTLNEPFWLGAYLSAGRLE